MEAFKGPGFLLWAVNGSKQESKMDAIYTLEKRCFCIMLGERNKDLLFSTGNYIQYLEITYNKNNLKKYTCISTYIYTYLNHFAV